VKTLLLFVILPSAAWSSPQQLIIDVAVFTAGILSYKCYIEHCLIDFLEKLHEERKPIIEKKQWDTVGYMPQIYPIDRHSRRVTSERPRNTPVNITMYKVCQKYGCTEKQIECVYGEREC
jgi:hypothetical protein